MNILPRSTCCFEYGPIDIVMDGDGPINDGCFCIVRYLVALGDECSKRLSSSNDWRRQTAARLPYSVSNQYRSTG